jgi:hypothetical protein
MTDGDCKITNFQAVAYDGGTVGVSADMLTTSTHSGDRWNMVLRFMRGGKTVALVPDLKSLVMHQENYWLHWRDVVPYTPPTYPTNGDSANLWGNC